MKIDTIEKGVPLPVCNGRHPWKLLEIGESFVVEDGKSARSLAGGANTRQSPKKFVSRAIGDGKRRIWRIE